jgi:hypothetical protein
MDFQGALRHSLADGVEDSSAPNPAEAVGRAKGPASLPLPLNPRLSHERPRWNSKHVRLSAHWRFVAVHKVDTGVAQPRIVVLWLRAGGYLPDLEGPSVRRYIVISRWDPKNNAVGRHDVIADSAGAMQRDDEPYQSPSSG